jgi:large subunit ribosomal protein L22
MAEENTKKVATAKKPASTTTAAKKAPAKKAATKTTEKKTEKVVEKKEEVKVQPILEEKELRTSATAELRNYGVTPRKVRLVIDLVRGKDLDEAYAILDNCQKLCAKDIKKLIKSAEANAVNNFKLNRDTLYVAEISANDAIRLKRILPRAKGSASGLIKRWSHVFVTVKNREAK